MKDMAYFKPVKQAMDIIAPNYLTIKRIMRLLNLSQERLEIYCRDDNGIKALQALGQFHAK